MTLQLKFFRPLMLSLSLILLATCASPGKRTGFGAGIGAAAGAGLGALIGSASGSAGKGALIGGAAGALLGGSVGNRLDKQAQELAQYAETRRTENGIITRLKGDILFDVNSKQIKGAAADSIEKIAAILAKYPENRIKVIGHTDSSGSEIYNKQLSIERAETVAKKIKYAGVPSSSINAIGQGELAPIASNDSKAGRYRNRRVDIEITVPQTKN